MTLKAAELYEEITNWLKKSVFGSGGRGAVLGLSGGIDSAVVAALCKSAFGKEALGLIMPCYGEEIEKEHALLAARQLGLPHEVINLDPVFEALLTAVQGAPASQAGNEPATSNIKPRLRMIVLYYFAARRGYRVIGTGNRDEFFTGYFTKHGDSGVDLEPIGALLKEEVRELALYAGIPREIIDKKPTAGLWAGQTDEEEMGFTYEQLDAYLKGGAVSPPVREKIEWLNRYSEHKRQLPPIFQKKV
jgi:NAD+ synthase